MFNINKNERKETMSNEKTKKTLDQQFSEKSGIDVSKKVRGVDLAPLIGMGVTRSINGDSYPYTIIEKIINSKVGSSRNNFLPKVDPIREIF